MTHLQAQASLNTMFWCSTGLRKFDRSRVKVVIIEVLFKSVGGDIRWREGSHSLVGGSLCCGLRYDLIDDALVTLAEAEFLYSPEGFPCHMLGDTQR